MKIWLFSLAIVSGFQFQWASIAGEPPISNKSPFSREPSQQVSQLAPQDFSAPEGLPSIGKWMLDPDLAPAHWLGEICDGKSLREPINVIIIDPCATSEDEAKRRLIAACRMAGFDKRDGHSSGYSAYIGGQLYRQLPEEHKHAFSDAPFEFSNNHGRIFGPFLEGGKFYFIGAFSREKVRPLSIPKHQYFSFNLARDHFVEMMDRKTDFKVVGLVDLKNAIVADGRVTTGDHDGKAVVLSAER